MAKYDSHFQEGTPLVWLTRDRKEVQKYVDDPFCGFPFCVELVRDWCRGLEKINKPEELNKMRRDLPVLFVTGEKDPANNNMRYIEELLADYKTIGMKDVTSKVYPDARHEVLNETNRQEVYRDIVHWLDRQLRS
jgi:alpha-beta hydrolase superfamily lysophospholipase